MLQDSTRAGILIVLLLCAAAAVAQSPVTNSYDINLSNAVTVNNCATGEPVALSGTVHVSYSLSTDNTGVNNFAISAANNLAGSGRTTGMQYSASDSDNYSSNTSDTSADLTVELKSDLKPQGPLPGLTLVQSLHIVVDNIGNISAQVVSNSTTCGS